MVKKSKKPKYCENSNMFSGILNVATNVSLIPFLTNKKHKNYQPIFIKKELSVF